MTTTLTPDVPPQTGSPLHIADGCWMIGFRNASSLLQCNTYLRVFAGRTNVCIDPGSQFDRSVIEANVQQLLGSASALDVLTVNHQDPDVVGNLAALCELNPHATVMVAEETWRLVQHLLVRPGHLLFPLPLSSRSQKLPGGHALQPVPTPFCHFRGAMAYYDPESQVLFSGDLLGGLNQLGRVHLFAEESDWPGIAQFHQIYMPSRSALQFAVRQIRALRPEVKVIAPQHGYVIAGDLVSIFLERLENLQVGYELLEIELDQRYFEQYRDLIDEMLVFACDVMGDAEVGERLHPSYREDGLREFLTLARDTWEVTEQPYTTAARLFARLTHNEAATFTNDLRDRVLGFCSRHGIPVPPAGWGVEATLADGNRE